MAKIKTCGNIESITGTVDKTARIVTRVKKYRDPITGEIIGYGPNEYYILKARSTPYSQKQKEYFKRFGMISTQAYKIANNKNHPRYKKLYDLFRSQLNNEKPILQFPKFICSTLLKEML